MRNTLLFLTILFLIPDYSTAQTPLDTLRLKSIFHEPYIPGVRPGFSHFSNDGKTVYFNWNEEARSRNSLYEVPIKGGEVKKAPEDIIRNYTLSPDGKKVVYQKDGDLMLTDADFKNARTIVASKGFDYGATFSPDGKKLAYVVNGDVWVTGLGESLIQQITQKGEDDPNFGIVDWAGNDKLVLSQWDNSAYKEYFFPEYVGTYVETGSTRRGIPTTVVSVANIDSGSVEQLFKAEGWTSTEVSADGKYAATDWTDGAMKKREITSYNLEEGSSSVVFEDSTTGWMYGRSIEFAPSGSVMMIQSERDGWNHVYTMNADGTNLKQHTSGDYDIPFAEWLDEKTMVIATSELDPGDIQLYKLELSNNKQTKLTETEGHRRNFRLSRDKKFVVYSKTFFNEPAELYSVEIRRPGREYRLTDSTPDGFEEMGWQTEDYVRFTGRDGETALSASILKPDEIDQENGNPVVVFVHGAGSLQNVFKGWSFSYWREYMFNQYLTKQGYYVVEVDYRHSTGYGRKFREDVTGWMGKYETEDIEDGLAYLAENYPAADTSRVGIYGGSYGGFMALYAVGVAPEHFDAAAALRSVTNWENYYYTNPWYTKPRLGTPEADSANYARSSPITYADSLQKPVLLLHGLIDNNVGFQDAVQYIERLIQTGNEDFDMMMYPSERHSFRDPDAWYDEYRRIYEFFEEKLKSNP
jgi:dipeptidyl aminopeptidase/acylaminoacyl peptidase